LKFQIPKLAKFSILELQKINSKFKLKLYKVSFLEFGIYKLEF